MLNVLFISFSAQFLIRPRQFVYTLCYMYNIWQCVIIGLYVPIRSSVSGTSVIIIYSHRAQKIALEAQRRNLICTTTNANPHFVGYTQD